MKYKFTHTETDLYGKETGKVLTMEFSADSIDDILENFEGFLRGSGFIIDGNLDVVKEDEDFKINLSSDSMDQHSSYYYDYDRNRSPEQMNLDFGEAGPTLSVNSFDKVNMSPFMHTSDDMFQDDLNGR